MNIQDEFTFLEPIKDQSTIYENHKTIFSILSNVRKAVSTKNASKKLLEKGARQCELFGRLYSLLFETETISRKQHAVAVVLPKFIRACTAYIFFKVEQKAENLHCTYNRLETQYQYVKNKAERFFLMIQSNENEMRTQKEKFERKNRMENGQQHI